MTSEQEDSGLFDFAFILYIGNFSGSLISPVQDSLLPRLVEMITGSISNAFRVEALLKIKQK